jgi:hypothetical protein
VETWAAGIASWLLEAVGVTSTATLATLGGLTARSLLLLAVEAAAPPLRLLRGLASLALIGLTWLYAMLAEPRLSLGVTAAVLAGGIVAGILLVTFYRLSLGAARERRLTTRAAFGLAKLVLVLGLVAIAIITLLTAGFLELSADRPVLMVELTGRTRPERIAWSPPNRPTRIATLTTHQVLMRAPAGERVSEAWIYGDQVAVKGRVLRLSPWLNAAGLPNLFELQFAHNGYATAARHQNMPPQAVELPASGPLQVHPWWRGLQQQLMEKFQDGGGDSIWIRARTVESTYFPLTDSRGDPMRAVYRVVLTAGGLSSS